MTQTETWYIVKQAAGHCEITTAVEPLSNPSADVERWGPFASESEAIARRVGLIRAGKCQPRYV